MNDDELILKDEEGGLISLEDNIEKGIFDGFTYTIYWNSTSTLPWSIYNNPDNKKEDDNDE
jgi:hypothetical protein